MNFDYRNVTLRRGFWKQIEELNSKVTVNAVYDRFFETGRIDAFKFEWKKGDEPYYPVNDERNSALYQQYKALAEQEKNIIFGGRLGEYKYYDMDAVIASALTLCEAEIN